MRQAIILVVMLILFSVMASAGTLTSASSVQVNSNYKGFDGLSLLSTWSTTPAASDYIVVNKNTVGIPEPYDATGSITISLPQPTYEQAFKIGDGTQMFVVETGYFAKSFYYPLQLSFTKANTKCEQAVYDYLSTTGGTLIGNIRATVGLGSCYVNVAYQKNQVMWIGDVRSSDLYFNQVVNVGNYGQLHIYKNEAETVLADNLPNVAAITFINFNKFTQAELSATNIYAYHTSGSFGSDAWQPFYDDTFIKQYKSEYNALVDMASPLNPSSYDAVAVQDQVNKVNSIVKSLQREVQAYPAVWADRASFNIRSSGNKMIVPILPSALIWTADYQILLSGDTIGLVRPTGEPNIISVDSPISIIETASGDLQYKVQNTGDSTGTFTLEAQCGTKVSSDSQQVSLAAGEVKSGGLRLTAKSTEATDTEKVSCTFTMTETQTRASVTKDFVVNVQVKQLCVQGEESDPVVEGADYVVYVLDSQCRIIDTIKCPIATSHFVFQQGRWECVDGTGKPVGKAGSGDTGSFSIALLIVSAIIGLVAAIMTYNLISAQLKKSKAGKIVIWIVVLGVFAFVSLVAIPWIWHGIARIFTT